MMDCSYTQFVEYMHQGREIEFTYNNVRYFISRKSDEKWYLLECSSNTYKYFDSCDAIINNAKIDNSLLCVLWDAITIDYVL